jgi:hypothetical protein
MLAGTDWLRPWWLERQRDPRSPDFLPGAAGGVAGAPRNLTHRDWTLLGALGTPWRAVVDPRGLVTPWSRGWSLDWWVGADDRWHLPSREAAVRQDVIDDAPVVETTMRIPGGDAVARAYVARLGRDGAPEAGGAAAGDPAAGYVVVVEVENRSAVPFALAWALRPFDPLGPAPIPSVAFDGTVARVGDRPAIAFPRPPARAEASTAAGGDVVHAVVEGRAGSWAGEVSCPDGRAHAAFVVPVPHTATARVVLPLRAVPADVGPPSAARVASGWAAQSRRGLRVDLPDERLSSLVARARRTLLLAVAGEDLVRWPDRPFEWADAAEILLALDRQGFHDEAAGVLAALPDHQQLDGFVRGGDARLDAPGAVLAAVGEHWALTGDTALVEDLVGPLAKAAHWIEKRRTSPRRRRDRATVGLLPDGDQPAWIGGSMVSYHDAWWSLHGLAAVAPALAAAGQPEVADDVGRFAVGLRTAVARSVAADAARLGVVAPPAGPGRAIDGGVVANLAAGVLDVLALDDPVVGATAELVRERADVDGAVYQAAGFAGVSARLTAALATVEARVGDRRALDRLRRLSELASPTGGWPACTHPRTGGGSAGDGHDLPTVAAVLTFLRRALVDDRPDGLALSMLVPDAWLGQGWEVHDAPTRAGRLGYAVRWHGDRPALLWELEPHPGAGADRVRITAPGLDPTWSTTEHRGEVLLAPVPPPGPLPGAPPGGPGGPGADEPPPGASSSSSFA